MRFAVMFVCASVLLMAQVSNGSLGGVIKDSQAGAIAEVTVVVTDVATGLTTTVLTNAEGAYQFPELKPGRYTLTASKSGFRTATSSSVLLEVNRKERLNIVLEPGAAPQSITVTADMLKESYDSSLGWRAESAVVSNLPLLGRNINALITLGPGAIPRQYGGFVHDGITDIQPARGAVVYNPSIHGTRTTSNRHVLDGASNTDYTAFATVIHPPLESVQEFRIVSLLPAAEFPQGGGGVLNVVTKSGAKAFHGSGFEFMRNQRTDSKNYFDDAKPTLRRNQFGGSVSSPLGLDRTFFFATYEGIRGSAAKSSLNITPDAVLRGGNFAGRNVIYDPLNVNAQTGRRAAFAGNLIPSGRIDSVAKNFLDRFQPLPNRSGAGGNYLDATPSTTTNDHASGRIDHAFTDESRFFARYNLNEERQRIADVFQLLPSSARVRAQQAALGYTRSGSHWLSETRLTFTRLRVFALPESAFKENIAKQLGINGVEDDPFTYGLPYFVVTNFSLRTDDPILPQTQRNNNWQVGQNVSVLRGRHTVKVGAEFTRFHMNYRQSQTARGQMTFTGTLTAQPGTSENAGDAFGDFLLGLPQNTERFVGAAQAYLRQNNWVMYAQDEWRLNSRITMNFGMRYEYVAPMTEQRGGLQNLDYSTLPAAPRLVRVNQPVNPDRNNFAPRVGLAWNLGKVVFRTGYGIYFSPEIATEYYDLQRNGLRNERNLTDGSRPVLTLRDPFPQTATTGKPSYFGLDRNARTPYVQQWSAGFEKRIGVSTVIEATYLGTKGNKLGRFRQFNTPQRIETGESLGPRPGDQSTLRAFPNLGPIVQRQHISNSIYHAMELKFERRFTGRFGMLASFAWSKSIDDSDSLIPGKFQSFGAQDERNLHLERGLSIFDTRRRVSLSAVYKLPSTAQWNWLTRNWELSGVATIQDGTPLNPVYFAYDPANSGTPNRPNVVAGKSVTLPRSQRTAERFFNTDAFSDPAPYTFGNAGRNILPGPGNVVLDAALLRSFRLSDKATMQWRVESFNFPNHPNWGIPGPYPDFGPFFGRIFSSGDPRRFQFGARVDF